MPLRLGYDPVSVDPTLMSSTHGRAARIRLTVLGLALTLSAFSAITFYRWGSSATDENLFTNPPSRVCLTTPVAGLGPSTVLPPAKGRSMRPSERSGSAATGGEAVAPGLLVGDLLLSIGEEPVRLPGDVARLLKNAPPESEVPITLLRPAANVRLAARVGAGVLAAAGLRDVERSVLVIDVTPGGASDRAGLEVGDLIVRINGKGFENSLDADMVMRAARVDRETAYDVIRANQPLTLHLRLARFGFELSGLAVVLTGALWILVGTALALARPAIPAAAALGVSLLFFGYVLSVMVIRRDFVATPFSNVRDGLMAVTLFLGVATSAHAEYFFPRERLTAARRRPLVWLVYGVALAGIVAVFLLRSNAAALAALVAVVLTGQAACWQARRARPPEDRRILRAVRVAQYLAVAGMLVVLAMTVMRVMGPGALLALPLLGLIPAAYVYTIANYRLLDLDLHVRRSVQYSVVSVAWTALSIAALLFVLWQLPSVRLPVPNLRMSGTSLELLDAPMTEPERVPLEKGALMVLAIGLAFLFRAVGRSGQRWIADKFHRTAYDYRRASRELADVMSSRLDLDGLADGLMTTLVRLMPLKRAGVAFVHASRTYCGARAHGFEPGPWSALCAAASADVVHACERATSEVDVQYVFPRLRRALEAAELTYLYPIRSHDTLVGVILVGEKRSEAAFEDDDFQFLGAIAHQVSTGVENAFLYEDLAEQERLRHELEIARRIQLESLPQFTPRVDGLDIAGVSIPAFEVGGDYYDYLDGDPRELTVVVGDVSGKGTSAALYMSKLQGILRSLHAFKLTPHELFVRTNDLLSRDLERRSFVTALGGFFHPAERRLVLARAGHLPLYHYSTARGEVLRVLPRGMGFGLSQRDVFDDELEEREIAYAPGDVFLFITDGITECLAAGGEDFGEERVMDVLRELARRGTPASALRDEMVATVRRFAADVEQVDDQTVVVVRAVA